MLLAYACEKQQDHFPTRAAAFRRPPTLCPNLIPTFLTFSLHSMSSPIQPKADLLAAALAPHFGAAPTRTLKGVAKIRTELS
ncbi:hypothetical protein AXW84_09140 [Hymenobacter sp. PAMC 26628]|nr:hypothetical protein AXW84_09140 [Hymenobacter sp. PAMC 26628]